MTPVYSLVVPIYNEEAVLPLLLRRLDGLLDALDGPAEAILVDDGSRDTSPIVLEAKADSTSLAVWGPDHEHAAVLVAERSKSAMMLMKNKDAPEVFAEAVDHGGELGVTAGRDNAAPGDRAALNITGTANGFSIFHLVNGRPESRLSFSKLGGGLELRTPGSKAATRIIGADKASRIEIDDADGNATWSAPK